MRARELIYQLAEKAPGIGVEMEHLFGGMVCGCSGWAARLCRTLRRPRSALNSALRPAPRFETEDETIQLHHATLDREVAGTV